jgi:hypothetical protein
MFKLSFTYSVVLPSRAPYPFLLGPPARCVVLIVVASNIIDLGPPASFWTKSSCSCPYIRKGSLRGLILHSASHHSRFP